MRESELLGKAMVRPGEHHGEWPHWLSTGSKNWHSENRHYDAPPPPPPPNELHTHTHTRSEFSPWKLCLDRLPHDRSRWNQGDSLFIFYRSALKTHTRTRTQMFSAVVICIKDFLNFIPVCLFIIIGLNAFDVAVVFVLFL